MRWLVDGMNLVGSRPDGWSRDRAGARRRLVAELGAFAARWDGESGPEAEPYLVVVFDGRERPEEVLAGAAAGVSVRFAPGGPNAADRQIAAIVDALEDPAAVTVVTSDGPLAATVRTAGAQVMGVRTFATHARLGTG